MQKITILLCFSLALSIHLFANKIDDLKTDADVEQFIHQFPKLANCKIVPIDTFYHTRDPFDKSESCYIRVADSLGVKSWTKADFDNNGKTDLLLNFYWEKNRYGWSKSNGWYVVMDEGDSFSISYIPRRGCEGANYPNISLVESIGNINCIIIYRGWPSCIPKHRPNVSMLQDLYVGIDTLIWRDEHFIECDTNIVRHNISNIKYFTRGGEMLVPETELTINEDLKVNYDTIEGGNRRGISKTITIQQFEQLNSLFNHILARKMVNNFFVGVSDGSTTFLEITYDGDKTYIMRDYMGQGSYGLIAFYSLIEDIKKEYGWIW